MNNKVINQWEDVLHLGNELNRNERDLTPYRARY